MSDSLDSVHDGSPYPDSHRFTITLPVELGHSLATISAYTGLTASGVIQILLEDSPADEIAAHIIEQLKFDSSRFLDLPPYARKALSKKRPTRENVAAVRMQLGELVPGGVKLTLYREPKHA